MEKKPSSELERELNNLLSKVKVSRVGLDKIKDSVKMYLAIKKIAFENNYDAVAFHVAKINASKRNVWLFSKLNA